MPASQTAREWLRAARARLCAAGLADTADVEAQLLLETASDAPALVHWAHPERELSPASVRRAEALLARRVAREPLAYVLGEASFYGRTFLVEPGVLVPREDSAAVIELALELTSDRPSRVLDVGVGSGCLLATLLLERPRWRGYGVDLDARALRCARSNLERHGLRGRTHLWTGDLLAALSARATFDLVVANPPYVTPGEHARCEPEVRDWEPRLALLVPEEDPLAPYRAIAARWSAQRSGAVLVCEVGAGRDAAVSELFRGSGAREVHVRTDAGGIRRAVAAVL